MSEGFTPVLGFIGANVGAGYLAANTLGIVNPLAGAAFGFIQAITMLPSAPTLLDLHEENNLPQKVGAFALNILPSIAISCLAMNFLGVSMTFTAAVTLTSGMIGVGIIVGISAWVLSEALNCLPLTNAC